MQTILGKTFVNPIFISKVIIEHPQLSVIKKEIYSISIYENQDKKEEKIYIFSQEEGKKSEEKLLISPNKYKYGSIGSEIFLVKQKQELYRKNFYQWRYLKALKDLNETKET